MPLPDATLLPSPTAYVIMLALLEEDHGDVAWFDVAPKGPNRTMRSVEDELTTTVGTRFSASAPPGVTIADIWEAHKLLKPRLHHTPLTPSRTLRELTGADIYLKAENTQRSGSFKVRGA